VNRAERRRVEKSGGDASPEDSGRAEGEGPSPLAPWVERTSLSLLIATVILRVFTSGGGIELLQPGVQILADSLGLCAAGCLVAARALGREPVFRSAGWVPWALLAWGLWLAWGASGAAHADLAWRSALTFTTLPLLGIVALELSAGRPERTALLLSALLAAVAVGALLAAYQGFVEIPALIQDYQDKNPELMAEIARQDPSYQMALIERLHSRGATGPFLLPGLLASVCAAVIPLCGLVAGRRLAAGAPVRALPALGVLVALALGLVLSRSKGAVVSGALVVGAALLLAPGLRRYRRRLLIAAGLGVAALTSVGLIALILGPERAGVGLSLTVRLEYWEAALAMWREAPLRGLGINQFREYYSAYKATQAEEALHAHNAPLQLLAETGLIGLALFAGTLALFVRRGLRVAWGPKLPAAGGSSPEWIDAGFLAGGLFFGWLLLGAHGDTYNGATTGAWLGIGVGVLALSGGLWWALRGSSPRLVAGAALAGATVLLGDGVLNFGVHHAGFSLVVWLLLGLAPGMASTQDDESDPARAGGLLGALVCALTLWVIGVVLPGALEAEGHRALARANHEAAASGRDVEDNLRRASESFAAACQAAPQDSRTWLERGAALARLGDQVAGTERQAHWEAGVAATREAIRLAPRNAGATFQLGRLLARPGASAEDLVEAQAAFDRTVELYPSHPEHLLEAASVRVRRAGLGSGEAGLVAQARALLDRAEAVSSQTRLKRIQLRPEQVERVARLRAQLGSGSGD
jgi:tetratricopeptide (TPR) repeat protein